MWVIRCFWNARGNVFEEEYRQQSPRARAEFRATLNGLRAQPTIEGWCRANGFDRLSGKYRKLGKLRFKVPGVQHRPLGFFGPGEKTFTLLVWATERDGKFDPPNVRDTALQRMNLVLGDPTRAHELDF
jgi:hypothetical protein